MIRTFFSTFILLVFNVLLVGCSSVKTASSSITKDSIIISKNKYDSIAVSNGHTKSVDHVVSVNRESSSAAVRIDTVYIEKEHTIVLRQSGDTLSDNTNSKERLISHHYNNTNTSTTKTDSISIIDSLRSELTRVNAYADSILKTHSNDSVVVKEKQLSRWEQFRQDIGDAFIMFIFVMICILAYSFYVDRKENK